MPRLRPLPARRVLKALRALGLQQVRLEGGHIFLRHPDGRTTVVPAHPGEAVGKGLLHKIIHEDIRLSLEEFWRQTCG